MGSPVAVSYANIYVWWVVECFLLQALEREFYLHFYFRLVDDAEACVQLRDPDHPTQSIRALRTQAVAKLQYL